MRNQYSMTKNTQDFLSKASGVSRSTGLNHLVPHTDRFTSFIAFTSEGLLPELKPHYTSITLISQYTGHS